MIHLNCGERYEDLIERRNIYVKPEKNVRPPGFEPMTSAIPDWGAGSVMFTRIGKPGRDWQLNGRKL